MNSTPITGILKRGLHSPTAIQAVRARRLLFWNHALFLGSCFSRSDKFGILKIVFLEYHKNLFRKVRFHMALSSTAFNTGTWTF